MTFGCQCDAGAFAGPRRRVDWALVWVVAASALIVVMAVLTILALVTAAPAPRRPAGLAGPTCIKVTTTGSYWAPGDAFGGTVCDYSVKPAGLSWPAKP